MVGVSPDSVESHSLFHRANSLPFPLVSDPEKRIMKLYDVLKPWGVVPSRITYVIDKEGIIRGAFHHELRIGRHIQDVLRVLSALHRE